ncbi:type VI secretion system Vgr family protein [Paraburkholderia sediminicola]|uniref:type VI secretion system Vgr family protein n=1 Tax=Paraburkholderia sediminicola TaxID=458836 RepID=UPI0038BD6D5D
MLTAAGDGAAWRNGGHGQGDHGVKRVPFSNEQARGSAMKMESVARWRPAQGNTADGVYTYRMSCEGYSPATFLVAQWQGEERISSPYRFEILLASSQDNIAPVDLRGRRATFEIVGADGLVVACRHGVLTSTEQLDRDDHFAYYCVTLEPRLARLREWICSDIYLNVSLPDLIRKVLQQGGLLKESSNTTGDFDFRIAASNSDSSAVQANFVCQYEESCLDFLSRRLEHVGWYFSFEQGEHEEAVVFYSARDQQPTAAIELAYRPSGVLQPEANVASVTSFRGSSHDAPQNVGLRDFAATRARLVLDVSQSVLGGNVGRWTRYGEHFDSERDAERLGTLRAELAACGAERFVGVSGAANLCVGRPAVLRDHFRNDCNIRYYVTEIHHDGMQPLPLVAPRDGAQTSSYRNTFVALGESRQYRPPLATPWPRIAGCTSAVIDGEGDGALAELNEHGCYKVRFAFGQQQRAGRNSAWLRLATPYGGAGHGMHFPLHKGSEVLVAFMNGDPDRPVIVGVVSNSENPGLVTQSNPAQNTLHTAGGNSLVMDDQAGAQRVALSSPSATTSLVLGAAAQNGMALSSQGHIDVQAGSYHRRIGSTYEEHIYGSGSLPHPPPSLLGDSQNPANSGPSTTKQVVSSAYHGGQNDTVDATEGAGLTVQNYMGGAEQNYGGGLSQTVQGVASNVFLGGVWEFFFPYHYELHRGIHTDLNPDEKETIVETKTVTVPKSMTLTTDQLQVTAANANLDIVEYTLSSSVVNVQADNLLQLESPAGIIKANSPGGVLLNSSETSVVVSPGGVEISTPADISFGSAGNASMSGEITGIKGSAFAYMQGAAIDIAAEGDLAINGTIIKLG